MKVVALVIALSVAAGATAQDRAGTTVTEPGAAPVPNGAPPGGNRSAPASGGATVIGPRLAPSRIDLWQLLTPEQRDQLWRSLTSEQRAGVWWILQPQQRLEMRRRLEPGDLNGAVDPLVGPGSRDRGYGSGASMMTPEERQQMREQIREAHRMRRERLDAERRRRTQ